MAFHCPYPGQPCAQLMLNTAPSHDSKEDVYQVLKLFLSHKSQPQEPPGNTLKWGTKDQRIRKFLCWCSSWLLKQKLSTCPFQHLLYCFLFKCLCLHNIEHKPDKQSGFPHLLKMLSSYKIMISMA